MHPLIVVVLIWLVCAALVCLWFAGASRRQKEGEDE